MTAQEIVSHIPAEMRAAALEALLDAAFFNGQELDFDHDVCGGDFVEAFCTRAHELERVAAENMKLISKTPIPRQAELDGAIHDAFSDAAARLSNKGPQAQRQYLVVEEGRTP